VWPLLRCWLLSGCLPRGLTFKDLLHPFSLSGEAIEGLAEHWKTRGAVAGYSPYLPPCQTACGSAEVLSRAQLVPSLHLLLLLQDWGGSGTPLLLSQVLASILNFSL
jgi:hypothetical protein